MIAGPTTYGIRSWLLTTDHKMRPDHAHPIFSPDSKRVLIQSGRLTDGASLDLIVVDIPARLLSPAAGYGPKGGAIR